MKLYVFHARSALYAKGKPNKPRHHSISGRSIHEGKAGGIGFVGGMVCERNNLPHSRLAPLNRLAS